MDGRQVVDILLVDDREENLLALEAVLVNPQYRLNRAMSGQEALDYLVKNDCAVILLDVQMPEMDGFETARRIRARPNGREIPIIFLTAIHRDDQYAQLGYEVGAVDFLMKPLDVVALRSKVAVFVDLHLKTKKLLEQEKQLYEASLRMTEERMRTVISHSSVMVWSIDAEGTYVLCEGNGLRDKGVLPENVVGRNVFELHQDNPKFLANIDRALSGEAFVAEVESASGDWLEVRYSPVFGEGGEVTGVIGVSADISMRKKAEAELLQAVQIRDEFLSIASHELKTPLTPLRLQLQLLQRQAKKAKDAIMPTAEVITKLDMAEAQIVRLTKLVDDLLDVSRMANRRLSIHREDMDLVSVVREVAGRFSEHAKVAGCTLTLDLPENLTGRWDRMRMEQIMTNLISNAIKYGERKPVEVMLREEGGIAKLAVKDQGIGISQENLDRVFERFERAVPGSKFGGLGLGLYIVRQLVEAHHGKIWVESELNRGSTFHVVLPCLPNTAGLTRGFDSPHSRPLQSIGSETPS